MSRSVDLFVDYTDDPHKLVVLIGRAVRSPLVETATGRWQVNLSAEHIAHLQPNPYIDDGDLRLSAYRWVVSARVGHDGRLVEDPATTGLRAVAESLRHHAVRVLLVLDLQNRVELVGPDPAAAAIVDGSTGDDPAGDDRAGEDQADEPLATSTPECVE